MRGTGAGRQGGGAQREKAAKFFRSRQDEPSDRLVIVKAAILGVVCWLRRNPRERKKKKVLRERERNDGPSSN